MKRLEIFRKEPFLTYCLAAGTSLGITSFDLQVVQPSIDSSYTYLHNMLLVNGGVFTGGVALTYGPLGFIIHALDFSYIKALAIIANGLIGGLTGYFLYLFLRKVKSKYWAYATAFFAALIVDIQLYEWKLFAVFLLGAFLTYKSSAPRSAYILAAVSTIFIYAKLSLGVASLSVLTVLLLIKRYSWEQVARIGGVVAASLVLGGILLFRSIELPVSYLYNGFFISAGYSEAMSTGPLNWRATVIYLLAGAGLALVAATIALLRQDRKFILAIAVGTFFVWKAAITRQDIYGHVEALPFFGLFISLFVVLVLLSETKLDRRSIRYGSWVVTLVGCGLMFWGAHLNDLPVQRIKQAAVSPLTFWKIELCQLTPCKSESALKLDPGITQRIGNGSVDVYPWESLFTYVNELNWQPRPSPASYASYAPHLDELNASFLASSQAPDYILWDIREGINGIDGRHIFFDEPVSLRTILANYDLVVRTDTVLLLQRKDTGRVEEKITTEPARLEWDQWVTLPDSQRKQDLTHITYEPNDRQKTGALLFRPEPVLIEVKKASGHIYTLRLVPQNARQGLPLEQLPFNAQEMTAIFEREKLTDPVTQIRLVGQSTGDVTLHYSRVY